MTLKEASVTALSILKQVMEEKLNSTNVEVSYFAIISICSILVCFNAGSLIFFHRLQWRHGHLDKEAGAVSLKNLGKVIKVLCTLVKKGRVVAPVFFCFRRPRRD